MYIYIAADLVMFVLMLMCRKADIKRNNTYLAICCAMWALIFGFRAYSVGNDTPGYAGFFEGTNAAYRGYGTYIAPEETIEWGFVYLIRFLHLFSNSATFFFLLHGIFLFTLIYYYYKDRKTSVMSLLWLMTTASMITTLMVAQRQSWSICFALLSVILFSRIPVSEHHTVKSLKGNYLFWAGLASFVFSIFVHRTSVVLFPILIGLYFLHNTKTLSYVVLISTTIFSIFYSEMVSEVFEFFLLFIGDVDNNNIALLSERYMSDVNRAAASTIRFLSLVLPACVTIYVSDEEHIKKFSFKCYIAGLVFYMLFSSSSVISRLVAMFMLIGFKDAIPSFKKNNMLYSFYILVSVYYLWRIIVGYQTDAHTLQNTYILYKFIWE